jgi:pimeloyl-ACP methyl ester carboxylesterase
MAATASPQQKHRPSIWRATRWFLIVVIPLLLAVVAFGLLRPLALMVALTQTRLRLDGVHSRFMDIPFAGNPSVRIHYYEGGSGRPLVLVHGLGGRAEDWSRLMPALVQHRHIYALDLPGYGRSTQPGNAQYSIPEETAAVEAFMDRLGLRQTDLAGWSMGGWIALEVALQQPRRIRRLIVFDSAGLRWKMTWNPNLFEPDTPQKLHTLDALLSPNLPHRVPRFVQRAIFRYVRVHGWVVRRSMNSMLTGQALLDGKLGALKMPVLIVWGKQDYLIPVSVAEAMHREIPQSELEIFDGCGHLAAETCAARIAPVVEGFLHEAAPLQGREAVIPQ